MQGFDCCRFIPGTARPWPPRPTSKAADSGDWERPKDGKGYHIDITRNSKLRPLGSALDFKARNAALLRCTRVLALTTLAIAVSVHDMATVLSVDNGAHQSRELILAQSGYQVLHAGNLHQALELSRSSTVDVIVLDCGSSVSTILPFTRLLRSAKPDVPLLLITDNAADADNEPEAACFNVVMSRLDGPMVLLQRLGELVAGTQKSANTGRQMASTTLSNASELRAHMRQLRRQLARARELSRQILNRKRTA